MLQKGNDEAASTRPAEDDRVSKLAAMARKNKPIKKETEVHLCT